VHGLHKNNWHDVPVIAVETEGTASFAASQKAGKLVTLDKIESIAKTLAAKTVSRQTLEWDKKHEIESVLVNVQRTARLTTLNRLIYMRLRGVNSAGICTLVSRRAYFFMKLE